MTVRQKRAIKTKKKILETALELFKERGFSNVTVDEIIQKTNTSKGSFYNYFKSKHDLFVEKFYEIDDFYVVEILPKLDPHDSAANQLKQFFSLQMAYIENDLGWDMIRTIYEHELNTETESSFLVPDRPLYKHLFNFCTEGQRLGEFRKDITPEQMVATLGRVTRGILYDWGISKGRYSLVKEHELLFEVVIEGLKENKGDG